jgi:hypothetical protein
VSISRSKSSIIFFVVSTAVDRPASRCTAALRTAPAVVLAALDMMPVASFYFGTVPGVKAKTNISDRICIRVNRNPQAISALLSLKNIKGSLQP